MISLSSLIGKRVLRTASATPFVRCASTLNPASMVTTPAKTLKPLTPNSELVFGGSFTDHMLRCKWTKDGGWAAPEIGPYKALELDPAASCLHYALECFEGMKAYRGPSGEIRLFRPELNMARMNNSMSRLFLPTFDEAAMLECIKQVLRVEERWVPTGEGFSLYIRPTGISTQAAEVFTIMSPVGPYYPEGFKPVSLLATNEWTRAWPGGTGNTKIGANYAPTILPQHEAMKQGFTQVLWLCGEENEVTEVGTMNFFLFWVNEDGDRELITPPLDGTILPGITRQSILDLCRGWGEFKVTEKKLWMPEVCRAIDEGRVIESFGCGTAAVVSPIKHFHFNGKGYDVPLNPDDASAGAGKLTKRLWDVLADIQYGRTDSEWSVVV